MKLLLFLLIEINALAILILSNFPSIPEQVVIVKTFDDDMKITTTHVISFEQIHLALITDFVWLLLRWKIKRSWICHCWRLISNKCWISQSFQVTIWVWSCGKGNQGIIVTFPTDLRRFNCRLGDRENFTFTVRQLCSQLCSS